MRLLALIILLCSPLPAFAQWQGPAEGQVRLVKLPSVETPYGVEFRLQFGWHTYWALPADAGLPPRAMANGTEVPLHFPKPDILIEGGMVTFGYVDRVVLPLSLADIAATKITIEYGICADICIPVQADLKISESAPMVEMPPIPTLSPKVLQVKGEGTRLVLLNSISGLVFLGVGSDYAVQAMADDKGWAVFELGSAAEVARALTQPLTLYRYDDDAAERYEIVSSLDGKI